MAKKLSLTQAARDALRAKYEAATDILETMKAEVDECVALLRPHYPDQTEEWLHDCAMRMRPKAYAEGRWPTDEEIAVKKAKEVAAEKEAAEKEAALAVLERAEAAE